MSLGDHCEGRVRRSDFLYRNGIYCLVARIDDSARNLSSRSSSSPKVQENVCFTFSSHSPPLKGLFFKTYVSGSRLTSSAEAEKNWHLRGHRYRMTTRSTSHFPPLPIKSLHEWRLPSMHIVQYTVQCKINGKSFVRRNTKSVRFHTMLCT